MKKSLLSLCILVCFFGTKAQNVTILPSGITPALSGTIPRLQYDQIKALTNPQIGDMAFDMTYTCLRYYDGVSWKSTEYDPASPSASMKAWSAGATTANAINSSSKIVADASNNIYVACGGGAPMTFGSTTASSSSGLYIVKYNAQMQVQWVATPSSSNGGSVGVNAMTIDNSGNIYIAGTFYNTVTFGTTTLTVPGSPSNTQNLYVAKINSSGAFQWALKANHISGYFSGDYIREMAIGASGTLYLVGDLNSTMSIGSVSITPAGANNTDIFILKMNASTGAGISAIVTGSSSTTEYTSSLSLDANENIYLLGTFQGASTTIGTTTLTGSASTSYGYVAVFSTTFNSWLWASSFYLAGNSLNIRYQNNAIYLLANGSSGFIIYYPPNNGVSVNIFGPNDNSVNGSAQNAYILKLSLAGAIIWGTGIGGTGTAIALDNTDNVYYTGSFDKNTPFQGIASLHTAGGGDILVQKIDAQGIGQWAMRAGGNGSDSPIDITVRSDQKIFMTGTYGFGYNSPSSANVRYATFGRSKFSVSVAYSNIFIAQVEN